MERHRKRRGERLACYLAVATAAVVLSTVAASTFALSGGTADTDHEEFGMLAANATVRIAGGSGPGRCTGTLVASDMVLASGHCIWGRDKPADEADFDTSSSDWEVPGRWYPVRTATEVVVGPDVPGVDARSASTGRQQRFTIDKPATTANSVVSAREAITLKTYANLFVNAVNRGDSYLGDDTPVAGQWETFQILKPNNQSGRVSHGDRIQLRTTQLEAATVPCSNSSRRFVVAENGGGSTVNVNRRCASRWETFVIERASGPGLVMEGDDVAFRTSDGLHVLGLSGAFRSSVQSYSLPVSADMILLKLAEPVPASAATPTTPLTRMPAGAGTTPASQSQFWANQRFTTAGFGPDGTGRPLLTRQRGAAEGITLNFDGNPNWIDANETTGNVQGGDSGGPLYWRDSAGRRWVVGALKRTGGWYVSTFSKGGTTQNSTSVPSGGQVPDIGSWLDEVLRLDVCISFDPNNARVVRVFGIYLLQADGHVLEQFATNALAQRGLEAVRTFRFARRCSIESNAWRVGYYLTSTGVPYGAYRGETSRTTIDRATLRLAKDASGQWELRDARGLIMRYGTTLAEYNGASLMRHVIERHAMNARAFIGPMHYFTR